MVRFEKFCFRYAGAQTNALEDVDFIAEEGEITVLTGHSGSGKTTLLKLVKQEIAPAGSSSGLLSVSVDSNQTAMVFQDPDTQLLFNSVKYDLVFQMENMRIPRFEMKRRLAETAGYFGLEPLLHKNPEKLSGGQKQLIALCSALMARPGLLLLDEPLSQLDPLAAKEFLEILRRINREFAVTIILSEHRLSDCIAIADKIAIMQAGRIAAMGPPRETLEKLWKSQAANLRDVVPEVAEASLRLFGKASLSPKELKSRLAKPVDYIPQPQDTDEGDFDCIEMKDIIFSYEGSGQYTLRRLSAKIKKGSITCVLGGNGSGKSTLLKLMAQIQKGYTGRLNILGKNIGYMPQNINSFFKADTVRQEIAFDNCDQNYCAYLLNRLRITHLKDRNPFDLSGGEALRICIASILLKKPDIVLLDEPTRGLDQALKRVLAQLLNECGATVVIATHDLEFAAGFAHRCILLFDGEASIDETARSFFKHNRYYTTGISRAFRHVCADVITQEDVMRL